MSGPKVFEYFACNENHTLNETTKDITGWIADYENPSSGRVMEKAGMKKEAVLTGRRKDKHSDTRYDPCYLFDCEFCGRT